MTSETTAAALAPRFLVPEDNFDHLIFGNLGNADKAREWLDSRLTMWTEHIGRLYKLSPAQLEKLRLVGRGDIKRLFDQVAIRRHEFQSVRNDVNRYRAFVFQVQSLNREVSGGLYGEGSLFAKVLKSIREEQRQSRRSTDSPAQADPRSPR